ncbi:tyrosine-type recombinase/integrase [Candidatus Tisiphia endosymbiont of Nemotelus uliginosus]|uniref:tyrosine-type recombinase/integrase n=1 Tax=Candidatus Tisiphia endosymbiont of Nemotelus uliginosus TaxID=3077926 RepID=UPI0035C88E2A
MTIINRTPVREKAKYFLKDLKKEQPDYNYLRELFRHIRKELDITVDNSTTKKLPYVPTEEEISKYYKAVWKSRNMKHVIIIKTLLYTGVRVSELVKIKISDIDLDSCQIRINHGKGSKDRIVPFPNAFTEVLAVHIESAKKNKTVYLFESSWKKPYSDRGIRKILMNYTKEAGIENSISPHKLRHFLFTWMKKKGVDDALIQPYSGHDSRQSLEIYSKLSLVDCQPEYEKKIKEFPV